MVEEVAACSPWLTGTHPCAAETNLARCPSLSAQPAPKAADVPPLCAIPHEKAPQHGKELALSSHWGRKLSSPQEGFAVGSKGCERLSCHGNRGPGTNRVQLLHIHSSAVVRAASERCTAPSGPEHAGGTGTSHTTLGGCWVTFLETLGSFSLGGETLHDAEVRDSGTTRVGKGTVRERQTDR